MTWLPWFVTLWLFLAGIYGIATSRNTIYLVSCLFVTQSSTYVLLLSIGYRKGSTAPILNQAPTAPLADPVVQALALTDIVVGATVSALLLVLAVQAKKRTRSLNPEKGVSMKG